MNILIANHVDADIVSTVFHKGSYAMDEFGFVGKCISIFGEFRSGIVSFLKMKWKFARTQALRDYGTVIFSNEAITAHRSVEAGT